MQVYCSAKIVQTRCTGLFLNPAMELKVLVSKQGISSNHRWLDFPTVYCHIVKYVKLVRKRIKVDRTYVLQLSTVNSNFYQTFTLKTYTGEATLVITEIIRTFKVLNHNVRGLYMAFLDTLSSIFWGTL